MTTAEPWALVEVMTAAPTRVDVVKVLPWALVVVIGISTLSLAAVTKAEVVTGTSLPSAFVVEITIGTRTPERVLGAGSTLVTISLVIAAGVLTTVLPPLSVVVTGSGVSTFIVEDATSKVEDESAELSGLVVAGGVVVVPSLLDPIEDVNPWSLEEESTPEVKEVSSEEDPEEEDSRATVLLGVIVKTAVLLPPAEKTTVVSVVAKVV